MFFADGAPWVVEKIAAPVITVRIIVPPMPYNCNDRRSSDYCANSGPRILIIAPAKVPLISARAAVPLINATTAAHLISAPAEVPLKMHRKKFPD